MEKTFHIQWHITDLCNLRCRHCYQHTFNAQNEVPFGEIEKIFCNISDFVKSRGQKLVLDITGGEPFLHKRWKDILRLAENSGIIKELGIITNGFFLDEKNVAFLGTLKNLKAVKISAEGVTKESYEFYRGTDTYEKFITGCETLKTSLPKTKKILMFTLTEDNAGQVPGLFDFIKLYNFNGFIIERFIPWGAGRGIKETVVSAGEWRKVLTVLCEQSRPGLAGKAGGIETDIEDLIPYRGFMVQLHSKKRFHLFGAPCIVGIDGLAVMPDGTVFPCRRFPLKIGNLRESSLTHIWEQSEVLKKARNKSLLKGKCRECTISNCFGCRALAYSLTGDFLEEDPLCLLT